MKVTVCTITYNRPKWLQETIDSVLAQKGVDLEYVICDNGSDADGGTQDVLSKYSSDSRFILLRTEQNNVGLPHLPDYATGDFITNLPDDDLLI